jgi:hypothetical protein
MPRGAALDGRSPVAPFHSAGVSRGRGPAVEAGGTTDACRSSLTTIRRRLAVNGWLMWGLVLPVLLVVAGVVVILRRRN